MSLSKATPRYVPTLTEVVSPVSHSPDTPSATWEPRVTAPADAEADLVARVLERLTPAIQAHIEQALLESAHVQARAMLPALIDDVDALVRSAVRDAVQSVPGKAIT